MLFRYALTAVALTSLSVAVEAAPDGPVVNTTSGSYIGASDTANAIDTFFGIRFASRPARFTPATPVANPPSGLQSALAFGSDCPQFPGTSIVAIAGIPAGPPLRGANQSEDCLFLNVWRPEGTSAGDKLPILIYIHGGGYFAGSGSEWNGTSLVQRSVATGKPIIFVTFNYRLGALGFLGSAQVPPNSLNIGLQDQRAALKFIQDNAESFGGDGSRIIISGESAGAVSVHLHYLYPDSQRTFRGGISSSGSSLGLITPACEWYDRPGGTYNQLGNITGCGTSAGSFECLQNVSFDTFWPLALTTYEVPGGGLPQLLPCKGPEGSLIDEYPVERVINGDFLNLPIITGTNRNEGTFIIGTSFLDLTPQPSLDEENSLIRAYIASQATNNKNVSQATLDKLLELYAHPTDNLALNSSLYNRAAEFATDYNMLAPERLFLQSASKAQRGQDVWAYQFEQHVPDTPDFLGVFHTSDLYYLDMGFAPVPSQTLQSRVQDFYISFTNDLNPGASWPKYSTESGSGVVMRLVDEDGGEPIADTLRLEQTDFLNQVDVMKEFGRFG
ncbi:Alpha/beta-hydrolase [Mycena sanguinolenta]|uniref:Carboxylic ester hydrolase n=1 Tax=Mycena sanguinolenta TaxID=230812 RepID=A0A8H7DA55_9AGAR|nr:Alpha/beta-hydrolase [Mycena sanguinolenta]